MGNVIFAAISKKGKDKLAKNELTTVLDGATRKLLTDPASPPAALRTLVEGPKRAYLFVNVATK